MNSIARWTGSLVSAVVVGAVCTVLLMSSSQRGADEDAFGYAVSMAVLSTPWALAAAILWHACWRSTGMDAPERLLAMAVATLPERRRDWGRAMTGELTQVSVRGERWRFAAGCARTALFPPRAHRLSVLSVAALVAGVVLGTWLAVREALPAMGVFAVTFAGLVGLLATVAVGRSGRVRRPAHGLFVTIAGLAGVAASVAVTGYLLAVDSATVLHPAAAIGLATALAGGVWLALAPPASSRLAGRIGLGVGLILAAALFLAARANDGQGILVYLPILIFPIFIASILGAAFGRSFATGIQTTVWAAAGTVLLAFPVFVLEQLRWSRLHPTSILDGDVGPIGGNLHTAIIWVLVVIPLLTVPFGVIGSALGSIGSRRRAG